MTANIAKNTFTVFTAKLITSFLIFLTGILVARSFGPAGVGVYDLFIAIVNFSVILGSLGIGIASIYLINRKKEDASQLFFHVLFVGGVWGAVLASLTYMFFDYFAFLPSEFPERYLFFAAIAIPFVLLQNYLSPFLLAKFRIYQWSFFSILYAGLIAVGAFLALRVFRGEMDNVVVVVAASSIVTAALLAFSVFRITSVRVRFTKILFARELRIGLTSYLGDIFQVASFKLNLFFVGIFLNIAQVGYYAVALNIANVFLIVPYAFQQVLYSSWSLLEEKDVDQNTPAMARQTLLVAIGAAAFIFLIGKYVVVNVLYGVDFEPSVLPLAILLPGAACMVFANTFFNNFFSRGKAYITTYILLFVSSVNIVLNFFLIPYFGTEGAAFSVSFSYFIAAVIALLWFSKISGFPLRTVLAFQGSDFHNLARQLRRFSGIDFLFRTRRHERIFSPQRRIKVCFVTSADISLRFLLFSQMKYLHRSGFDVYAASSSGAWVEDITGADISHKTIRIVRKVFTPIADIVALVQLFLFFKKERFDIVHTHTLKASFLGQIAAFLAGVPVRVYTIHGLDFLNTSFPPAARSIFKFVDRIIAHLVHLMFSVNKETLEIVQREKIYGPDKIAYLGVCIDTETFDPSRFNERFILQKKQEIGVPAGAKVIGMVGRLVKEKGYPELFEAFQQVLKTFPEAVLLIAGGEEPEKQDSFSRDIFHEYGIEGSTIFLGERSDIDEIDAIVDVLVLPSYREGLGITLLEASAMKKPVIASDISGCREAVDDNKTGILVPVKNAEKLAGAIVRVLSNPQEAKLMGEAGRKKVEGEFDEKLAFAIIKREYDRLLREKKLSA